MWTGRGGGGRREGERQKKHTEREGREGNDEIMNEEKKEKKVLRTLRNQKVKGSHDEIGLAVRVHKISDSGKGFGP